MLKRISLSLAVLFLSSFAFAQGARYEAHPAMKQRPDGALIPVSATIAVCTQPATTNTTPCSPLATLYTDATLTTPCTGTLKDGTVAGATNCSNPLVTDSKGNYHFYASTAQFYTVQVSGSGIVTSSEADISIPAPSTNSITVPVTGTLSACYALLPSTGGTCVVPANYAETLSANLVLNKTNAGFLFTGPATITMGSFQVTSPSSVYNVFIKGTGPAGKLGASNVGVMFNYSGTSDAFVIGDNLANCIGTQIENIVINSTNSAQSGAGLRMKETAVFLLKNLTIQGANGTNQIGLVIDGNNSGIGTDATLSGGINTTQTRIGMQFINLAAPFTFRGYLNGGYGGTGTPIGIDVQSGAGLQLFGLDINAFPGTAINIAGTSRDNYINAYLNANTTDIAFSGSTARNKVVVQSGYSAAGPIVTDTGTNNTVDWMGTRVLSIQGTTGATTGNSADQVLYSVTVPANAIMPGRGLRLRVGWQHTTGATSTAYKLRLDSTTTLFGAPTSTGVDNSQIEYVTYELFNAAGSQTSQNILAHSGTRTVAVANVTLNQIVVNQGSSAVDFTASHTFQFTFNVANTDQITGKFFIVEVIQ